MTDCIFCKIVSGELPAEKVYEDDNVLAFLDINVINKGDVLVVPKKHYPDFLDIPSDELSEVIKITQKVAGAVEKAVNSDGYNISINNKSAAGQAVMHLHIHIVPRFKDDGFKLWKQKPTSSEERKQMQKDILQFLPE